MNVRLEQVIGKTAASIQRQRRGTVALDLDLVGPLAHLRDAFGVQRAEVLGG